MCLPLHLKQQHDLRQYSHHAHGLGVSGENKRLQLMHSLIRRSSSAMCAKGDWKVPEPEEVDKPPLAISPWVLVRASRLSRPKHLADMTFDLQVL